MSGSSGKWDQADEAIANDGKSTQTHTAKTKTKSSGKDDSGQTSSGKDDVKQPPQNRNEPETHDDDESQRSNSFLNWLAAIEEHDISFDSMPGLNIAYVRLLKDATRCEPSFPEFLRKGGGFYSYENFLATFNTNPIALVEIFGISDVSSPSIFKDIVGAWSLAVYLSIDGNGLIKGNGYLDFNRFDLKTFTVFLLQQRRARRVQLASGLAIVTNKWKLVYKQSMGFETNANENGANEVLYPPWHHSSEMDGCERNVASWNNKPNASPLTTS
jgi:hypothetical protein